MFGCRVNEAERIQIDSQLVEAGFRVDLASPSLLIINTCAITGKAVREAQQLVNQLKKKHPQARVVVTGCSATYWSKYAQEYRVMADLIVPNTKKHEIVDILKKTYQYDSESKISEVIPNMNADKFRYSNRLLVKIQDGCHRFCSYCIVPYLRGLPQSQKIKDIIEYINATKPAPSEVILSAINTEAFGKDSKESFIDLVKQVISKAFIPRIGFGSVHPWSLTTEFLSYYKDVLSQEKRLLQFFHVPVQSGSQEVLLNMRREYKISDVLKNLSKIAKVNPDALIATDIIVGYLGETEELFEETYRTLKKSPIVKFHVFRFSNRPHTAAFYLKKQLVEPTAEQKKKRSEKLIALSKRKYQCFIEGLIGKSFDALIIAEQNGKTKILLNNQVEGVLEGKNGLPGQMTHVTIIAAKNGVVVCKESSARVVSRASR